MWGERQERRHRGSRRRGGLVTEALSRRQFLQRASALGVTGLVLSAIPVAEQVLRALPAFAQPNLADATLQAFADTMVPGRRVDRTDLGNEIHPQAIAGADPEAGAVQADALLLYHHRLIGFDAIEPGFLSDLQARSSSRGGQFLDLPFDKRVEVCVEGLDPSNSSVQLWEAAASVAFTAFMAAATQINATIDTASGYQVMGLPGTAPQGYAKFSYGRRLSRERTDRGSLP